jgi:hypothetical protein
MTRFLLIVAVLLVVGLLLYLFLPRSKLEWVQAEQRDLELCFSLPYQLDLSLVVVAPQGGFVTTMVETGEKVETGQTVGWIKGTPDLPLLAPVGGIAICFTNSPSGPVTQGETVLAILPGETKLSCPMTTEQGKALDEKGSLEVQFPFSPQRVWVEVKGVEEENDGWRLTLACIDFLRDLARHPTGTLTAFYGLLPDAVTIPAKALFVQGGQLGVYLLVAEDRVFRPVTIDGTSGGMIAVKGIDPQEKLIWQW